MRRPPLAQEILVGHVHLIAVAVTLGDMRGAVQLRNEGVLLQLGRVAAQTHGVAHVAVAGDDVLLLLHRGDDRVGAVGLELGGVRVLDAQHVARVFDDHGLQAEAQAESRQLVFARVLERADLAVDATDAEAARNHDAVDLVKRGGRAFLGLALVGGDPLDVDLGPVGEAAGLDGLGDGQVGVRQVNVLADDRTLTSCLGWCTRSSRSAHSSQSTSWNGSPSSRTT